MITEILAEKMLTIPPVILQRGGGAKSAKLAAA